MEDIKPTASAIVTKPTKSVYKIDQRYSVLDDEFAKLAELQAIKDEDSKFIDAKIAAQQKVIDDIKSLEK